MGFSAELGLAPGRDVGEFIDAVQAGGGQVQESTPAPDDGVIALRATGGAVETSGFQGVVVHHHGGTVVRVLARTTSDWGRERLEERFGEPRDAHEGFLLWAWDDPRWSVEARSAGDGTWRLEAKFLDAAVVEGVLEGETVDAMYARLPA